MKRLVHESTSNYLSKDPSGDTTPGYRNRIHLRDIRIWQALACLSKGLRGVYCSSFFLRIDTITSHKTTGTSKADSEFRKEMIQETMKILLQKHHHAEVRYHAEIFAILILVEDPAFGFDNILFSYLGKREQKFQEKKVCPQF